MFRFLLSWSRLSDPIRPTTRLARRRLSVESLEDRLVPTAYLVDIAVDENDANFAAGDLSLREAIALANGDAAADVISFSPAVFGTAQTINIQAGSNPMAITGPVSISGPGASLLTVSGIAKRLFTIDDANAAANSLVAISGLTVTLAGDSAQDGGAISNAESLSIDSCVFSNCSAARGGAISQSGIATLTVKNSTFSGNTANGDGGAIHSQSTSNSAVAIDLSTFTGNTNSSGTGSGGAISLLGGNLKLDRSTVSGNTSTSDRGGGVFIDSGATAAITSSTISGNNARLRGGGLFVRSSTVTVTNTTFSGNIADQNGGAIFNNGVLTLVNCTITLNGADFSNDSTAEGFGGGLSTLNDPAVSSTLLNTIVAGNFRDAAVITDPALTGDDIDGKALTTDSANNLVSEPTAAGGLTDGVSGNIVGQGGNTIDITTILDIDLIPGPTFTLGAEQGLNANGGPTKTHALVQNSLAIGAASAGVTGFSPYDQRDAFRDPTAPDIGAYEVQHPLAPVGTPSTYAKTFQPTPSASANEAFVKGLYQSTLLRAPDAAGLTGWVNALNSGAAKTAIAFGFVNSVENRTNQVTFFYKYFLGRNPDPAGLAGWVGVLQAGADEGTVMSGFLLSPEFTGQNNNASFVNLMYYALLGRQADPGGFNGWVAALNSGVLTRQQVGEGFLRSIESITRVVVSDFGSYLKRTITPASASPYVSQIQAGTTFGRVAASILGSDEFFVAAGQNLT